MLLNVMRAIHSTWVSVLFHFKKIVLACFLIVWDFACHTKNNNEIQTVAHSFFHLCVTQPIFVYESPTI